MAREVGAYLLDELHKLPGIKEIRGRGLMIGIEFEESIKEVRSKLLFEEKVFTGVAGTNTIRLLPPLCLSMDEAKEFIVRFRKVLNDLKKKTVCQPSLYSLIVSLYK